jgi:hypothetical protein
MGKSRNEKRQKLSNYVLIRVRCSGRDVNAWQERGVHAASPMELVLRRNPPLTASRLLKRREEAV